MSATDPYAFPFHVFAAYRFGSVPAGLDDVRLADLFDAWVFAAREAELALGAWASSAPRERSEAHAVYRAALDREECAAAVLASAVSIQPVIAEHLQ